MCSRQNRLNRNDWDICFANYHKIRQVKSGVSMLVYLPNLWIVLTVMEKTLATDEIDHFENDIHTV